MIFKKKKKRLIRLRDYSDPIQVMDFEVRSRGVKPLEMNAVVRILD